jgi:hypothetical protein
MMTSRSSNCSRSYRDACTAAGVDPLPDDEARVLARKFRDVLLPAFEAEFRLH